MRFTPNRLLKERTRRQVGPPDKPLIEVTALQVGNSAVTYRGEAQLVVPVQDLPELMFQLQAYPAPELETLVLDFVGRPPFDRIDGGLFRGTATPRLYLLVLIKVVVPKELPIFQAPLTVLVVRHTEIWDSLDEVLEVLHRLPTLRNLILDYIDSSMSSRLRHRPCSVALPNLELLTLGLKNAIIRSFLNCIDMPSNTRLSIISGVEGSPRHNRRFTDYFHDVGRSHVLPYIWQDLRYTELKIDVFEDYKKSVSPGCTLTASVPLREGVMVDPHHYAKAPASFQYQFSINPGGRLDPVGDEIPALCCLLPQSHYRTLFKLHVYHPWFRTSAAWFSLIGQCPNSNLVGVVHVNGTSVFAGLLQALVVVPALGPRGERIILFPRLLMMSIESADIPQSALSSLVEILKLRKRAGLPIRQVTISNSVIARSTVEVLSSLTCDGSGVLQVLKWDQATRTQ